MAEHDDLIQKKNELVEIMQTMKFRLMEKYSTYTRHELESDGISLREQWEVLKENLVKDCDIPRINYHLDLADEKRIGKAKVVHSVVTQEEAFAHLDHLIPCRENAFLLRNR